eukprot:GHUV01014079.1.p1 GENE.GHUV01014079.1~~GHUV01014079.1.p1  ORF type:complete len:243 (+),score=52.90 GHUV01014079.1:1050-1778(+)
MQTCLRKSVVPVRTSNIATQHWGRKPAARAGACHAATVEFQKQHSTIPLSDTSQHPRCGMLVTSNRRQVLQAEVAAVLLSATGSLQPQPAVAAGAAGSCQLHTSSSGLQWCDIVVGNGALPIKGAFTKAHYTATLEASGAQFESSYRRKQPLIFKVGEREVIEAWDVAILGSQDVPPMHEGGKRLIVAPPGPLQKQGTKSLVWVVGLSEAIAEAGLEVSPEGAPTSPLMFEIELLKKRGNRA